MHFSLTRVVPRYIGFLNGHCSTHFLYPRHRFWSISTIPSSGRL